jgi:hypothetical protein
MLQPKKIYYLNGKEVAIKPENCKHLGVNVGHYYNSEGKKIEIIEKFYE